MEARTWIVNGVRTPMGAMNGALASIPAPRLGAACIEALLRRTRVEGSRVNEVIMGNVIGAGLGQNPARQAAIFAGLPHSVGATTVSKVCGSGLKAVMLGDQAIRLGDAGLVVAGGMESMSRATYLLTRAREGYRLGHGELIDAMIHDGLWDVYNQKHMGTCGDACARRSGSADRNKMTSRSAASPGPDRRSPRGSSEMRSCLSRSARGARPPSSPTMRGRRSSTSRNCGHSSRLSATGRQQCHDHGRERIEHQRRRGGGLASLPMPSVRRRYSGRWRESSAPRRTARNPVVHDGAGLRHPQAARRRRLGRRPGRSLRDQRSIRRGRDGGRTRALHPD